MRKQSEQDYRGNATQYTGTTGSGGADSTGAVWTMWDRWQDTCPQETSEQRLLREVDGLTTRVRDLEQREWLLLLALAGLCVNAVAGWFL